MALEGSKVLAIVNTGTIDAPVWEAVGEQTELTIESTINLIDVTSKSSDHTKWLYGVSDDTVTLSAMYIPDDVAMAKLRNALINKDTVLIRRSEDGSYIEEAEAYVESISDSWPNNDASTTEVSFQLNTEWVSIMAVYNETEAIWNVSAL